MTVLFMGTPDFAATILEELLAVYQVIGVVTQPDKEKGRGKELAFSPVKELAIRHGLPVYQPRKVREPEFLGQVRELRPDVIVVAAFGQLLPKELLDIPEQGCINVHASLLPKYRGAAPIQYSIIDGEEETGITIMYMDVGLDTGDIILQDVVPITRSETGGSLFEKMAEQGAASIIKALGQIELGEARRTPQENEKATYVKMIDKEMGRLDFTKPAVQLERLIRGLNPWPSAYTFLEGKTLKFWKAEVENTDESKAARETREVMLKDSLPGTVVEVRKDALVILTGDGLLVVKELQLEGKKRMPADAFLRGFSVTAGTMLG
ncbi:MAG TPA: methionyl-tRNA formyltransferase [Clostridiales bacterium]|nr:methionyl-tRNA formyltransferase [Clostridiales bacterium]